MKIWWCKIKHHKVSLEMALSSTWDCQGPDFLHDDWMARSVQRRLESGEPHSDEINFPRVKVVGVLFWGASTFWIHQGIYKHWGKSEHLKVEGRHHFKGEKNASQRKRKSLYSPYGVFFHGFFPMSQNTATDVMAVDATATFGKIFPYLNLEVYRTLSPW